MKMQIFKYFWHANSYSFKHLENQRKLWKISLTQLIKLKIRLKCLVFPLLCGINRCAINYRSAPHKCIEKTICCWNARLAIQSTSVENHGIFWARRLPPPASVFRWKSTGRDIHLTSSEWLLLLLIWPASSADMSGDKTDVQQKYWSAILFADFCLMTWKPWSGGNKTSRTFVAGRGLENRAC